MAKSYGSYGSGSTTMVFQIRIRRICMFLGLLMLHVFLCLRLIPVVLCLQSLVDHHTVFRSPYLCSM